MSLTSGPVCTGFQSHTVQMVAVNLRCVITGCVCVYVRVRGHTGRCENDGQRGPHNSSGHCFRVIGSERSGRNSNPTAVTLLSRPVSALAPRLSTPTPRISTTLIMRRVVLLCAVVVLLFLARNSAAQSPACTDTPAEAICTVSRFAGSSSSTVLNDVSSLAAGMHTPSAAVAVGGTENALFVSDTANNAIRRVDFATGLLLYRVLHLCTCNASMRRHDYGCRAGDNSGGAYGKRRVC